MTNENVQSEETETFEAAMNRLEKIISHLEQGDVPLEQAIEMYQEGMKLSKRCHDQLQHVEKQMDRIITETGETIPLNLEEGDGQ